MSHSCATRVELGSQRTTSNVAGRRRAFSAARSAMAGVSNLSREILRGNSVSQPGKAPRSVSSMAQPLESVRWAPATSPPCLRPLDLELDGGNQ